MRSRSVAFAFLAAASFPMLASAAEMSAVVTQPSKPMIAVQVGGGVNDFTTKKVDKATDTGAAWDVRAIGGLPMGVGAELAYVGSVNAFKHTDTDGANLLRNGGEALLRANLAPLVGIDSHFISPSVAIQPYVAAGVGGSESRIVDDNGKDITTSNGVTYSKARTNVNIPGAVGVDALIGKAVDVGARASYRYDFDNKVSPLAEKQDIQSWQATARVGLFF